MIHFILGVWFGVVCGVALVALFQRTNDPHYDAEELAREHAAAIRQARRTEWPS